MNSLLKAFLFAPAIVSAFVLPSGPGKDIDAKSKQNDIVNIDPYTMGFVRLDIGHDSSSADMSPLNLRIDILHSAEACGFGNVTIDGQALSQTFDPESLVSSGKGSISTSKGKIIVGSWTFDCIIIDGKQHGQLMKFMVDFLDGKPIENSGFSVLFRQTEETEIMNIETISFQEDQVIENHLSHDLSSERQHHNENGFEGEHGHHIGHKKFNFHKEMAEVRYMKAQLKELKYLIHEKERHISKHIQENHNPDDRIRDCDSLRCVAEVISGRARKFYGKIAGDGFDEEYFHHSLGLQSKSENFGKGNHGKPGNHTSKDHTHPYLPSHPHHILPICHYPPPHPHNPHHDGPHGPPPRGPPPHEFEPPRFDHERHPGMHPFHEEEDGRPWEGHSRHYNENYGRLHGDEFDEEFERPHEKHAKPHNGDRPLPFDNPEFDRSREYHGKPPYERPFDGPEHGRPHHPQDEGLLNGPPKGSPHHENFEEHKPEFDGPPGDHPDVDGPPPHDEPPHGGPPPHMIEGGDHGPPPPHGPPGFPFHTLKFALTGFLFSIVIIALHRRTCNPQARSDRQARRGERCKRIGSCGATKRASLKAWWAWVMGKEQEFDDKDRLLESCEIDDDDDNLSVGGDITSLRNAANVVGDMVAAEEGRSISLQQSSHTQFSSQAPLLTPEYGTPAPHFDTYRMVIQETLPAYEGNDHDGSEASSLVADGFRYTPGSSDYSPSHLASGSVSDILGDKH
ncbi:hypothetical protein EYC80_010307 [Monilinia laxa]|uniref:Uncharacterized protein n=1 Tax=Monilinia laxa TaxID=61186 RepID=A0A5N6JPU6_MONLA|nr:hypothetical protein EYC80_010307 [Monilinia laxa]